MSLTLLTALVAILIIGIILNAIRVSENERYDDLVKLKHRLAELHASPAYQYLTAHTGHPLQEIPSKGGVGLVCTQCDDETSRYMRRER